MKRVLLATANRWRMTTGNSKTRLAVCLTLITTVGWLVSSDLRLWDCTPSELQQWGHVLKQDHTLPLDSLSMQAIPPCRQEIGLSSVALSSYHLLSASGWKEKGLGCLVFALLVALGISIDVILFAICFSVIWIVATVAELVIGSFKSKEA